MTRFFSIAVLFGLSLIVTNKTEAKGPSNNGSKTIHQNFSSSKSFRTYSGISHRHWSSWCWNAEYRCYFYYCPTECCSYYWYAPGQCYYPVSCLRLYRPTVLVQQLPVQGVAPVAPLPVAVTVPITVVNNNQNTAINGNAAVPVPVTAGTPGLPRLAP